jgi:hypothetical protein
VFYIVFIKVFSRFVGLFDKNRAKENAHRAQFFLQSVGVCPMNRAVKLLKKV